MKNKISSWCIAFALFTALNLQISTRAQGTAFTYQGRLNISGIPANGSFDLTFTLYNVALNGTAVGVVTNTRTSVTNGLFTTALDFGPGVFAGASYWLELGVRTNGGSSFATLAPRQQITPVPYAIYATTAGNAATATTAAAANSILAADIVGTVPLALLPAAVATNNEAGLTLSDVTVNGNLNLQAASTNAGVIYSGGTPFISGFGMNNFFAGAGAGNLNLVGIDDTGVGVSALSGLTSGNYNVAFGYQALYNDTSGSNNVADGWEALYNNTTGNQNTANGYAALTSNTTGGVNTATGNQALHNNTSGSDNTASGWESLFYNTSGGNNTADGAQALFQNTTGANNTASGNAALRNTTSGSDNTANGRQTLYTNTTGSFNVADGENALYGNTSGSNNVALGYQAGYNITVGSSNIDIGNVGVATDTSIIRIGTAQTQTFIAGVINGNGGGLTNLNAAQLISGTLPLGQLPGAVLTNNASGVTLSGSFTGPLNGNASSALSATTANNFSGLLAGDVSGTQSATVVSAVGDQAAASVASGVIAANAATSANSPNTIVKRDASGNLSAGTVTATSFSGNGTFAWQVVSGTNVQMAPNKGYLLTNNAQVQATLPLSPNVGDIVRITGSGAGGWELVENSGQSVIGFPDSSTWVARTNAPSTGWYCVASSADGTKLAAGVYGGDSGIYTSTDSGVLWNGNNNILGTAIDSVACSADGSKLIAGGYGLVYTSGDSGATWTVRLNDYPDDGQVYVTSSADGTKLAYAWDINGGIYTSSDSGITWTNSATLTNDLIAIASSADGSKLVLGTYDGQIYTSSDSGVTWSNQNNSPTAYWYSVTSSSDGTKLAAGAYGGLIYTSSDSGATWSAQYSSPSANWASIACSADGTKLLAGSANINNAITGNLYSSSDSGVTWVQQTNAPTGNWYGVAMSADGTKLVAAQAGGQIYTSGIGSFLAGGLNSGIELQYLGNGQFLPISSFGNLSAY